MFVVLDRMVINAGKRCLLLIGTLPLASPGFPSLPYVILDKRINARNGS